MVIDDDPGVRDSLGMLLRSAGFRVQPARLVIEFSQRRIGQRTTCLVLDVRLPGQSGLDCSANSSSERHADHLYHARVTVPICAAISGAIES